MKESTSVPVTPAVNPAKGFIAAMFTPGNNGGTFTPLTLNGGFYRFPDQDTAVKAASAYASKNGVPVIVLESTTLIEPVSNVNITPIR